MIFATPWLLLLLPALPALWWLLRVTPPSPATVRFPAIRLLTGLTAQPTAARTPWWLLALRLLAAALLIVGLAGPIRDGALPLPGTGPVVLVIDNSWAAASDWPARMQAATAMLDRAEREGRPAVLLATASVAPDASPVAGPALPAGTIRTQLGALRPMPWPADRRPPTLPSGAVFYLADGVAQPGDEAFAAALRAAGPVTELRADPPTAALLRPGPDPAGAFGARMSVVPRSVASTLAVLAQTGDGRTLARTAVAIPAGADGAAFTLDLPAGVRNQLGRLVLEGPPSAGAVLLLDERWRRRPVGLVTADEAADAPLTGPLFYVRRALSPTAELRDNSIPALIEGGISVLLLADTPLAGPDLNAVTRWVEAGGTLIRFAGPRLAEAPDSLLPVTLLAGDRQLGGALSWTEPAAMAPFPPASPFAGLTIPEDVRINRQVLAEPSAGLVDRIWAGLADGTPLVTGATRGAGRVVLFHVTANADWSNLPLSGLFVDLLRRVVALSAGVATVADDTPLHPAEALDGFGTLGQPPATATALPGSAMDATVASPRHPPGLYGPAAGQRALNLGSALPPLGAAALVGTAAPLSGVAVEQPVGPVLVAAAVGMLALDLILSLGLRGLLRPALACALLWPGPGMAQRRASDDPALTTRLAYVQTGDAAVDAVSAAGLAGLSALVNRRTAATLGDPAPVTPGQSDLSFYPLLYWPILSQAPPADTAALNDYIAHGGIILIDTRGAGSGEGFAPGADASLRRAAEGLNVPPLAPLGPDHVLARSFYLLSEYPGRYTGGTVWVARDQDRGNDSVSPVVIGGNDWAAAWATDAAGRNPYATVPGGARQRVLAYRFGINLVMYALTGNYKGDQVHIPALLERLGQ